MTMFLRGLSEIVVGLAPPVEKTADCGVRPQLYTVSPPGTPTEIQLAGGGFV
jgi:hypothetical protein